LQHAHSSNNNNTTQPMTAILFRTIFLNLRLGLVPQKQIFGIDGSVLYRLDTILVTQPTESQHTQITNSKVVCVINVLGIKSPGSIALNTEQQKYRQII